MEKHFSSFGNLLASMRKNVAKMPQWRFAAKCEIAAPNLRKIEKGETQPGVMLAVRLLAATGADVGECFRQLAEEEELLALANGVSKLSPEEAAKLDSRLKELTETTNTVPCPFGLLFREVRTAYGISQKTVAEKANYNLRNMLEVENGRREPGVMTALAMVCATGCDVGWFFQHCGCLLHKESHCD